MLKNKSENIMFARRGKQSPVFLLALALNEDGCRGGIKDGVTVLAAN